MIILKHGKKPEPKRWKFRCKLCGCEWIADETEVAERWSSWCEEIMVSFHHAKSSCPTCGKMGDDLCKVEPDEYKKVLEQVETMRFTPINNTKSKCKRRKRYD